MASSVVDLLPAVIKATTPVAGSTEERVEGDPVGMMELTEYVRINPNCLPDLCKHLKARLKDADQMVSRISLDVIDQCQQAFGFVFQSLVVKNMLKRILIMSEPKSGLTYKLRELACKYLLLWGERYGIDPRLKKFKEAGMEIRKRAAKDEEREMKAMAEAARVAKQADMEELKAQLMSQGKSPTRSNSMGRVSSASSSVSSASSSRPSPAAASGSSPNLLSSFGKNSGRNLLNAAKGPQMGTVASATFQGLKPMVEEHLGMLAALMDGASSEDVANSYEAEKSARSCTILRNKLEAISEHLSSTNKHGELVECLGITEELTRRLHQYEKLRLQFGAGGGRMARSSSRGSTTETQSSYSGADTDRSLVQGVLLEAGSTAGSVAGAAGEPSAPSLPVGGLSVPKANQIEVKEARGYVKENQIVPKFGSAPIFHSPTPGTGADSTLQTPPWSGEGSEKEEEEEEEECAGGPDRAFLTSQLDPSLLRQLGLDDASPAALSPARGPPPGEQPSPSTSSVAAAAAGVDPWQVR